MLTEGENPPGSEPFAHSPIALPVYKAAYLEGQRVLKHPSMPAAVGQEADSAVVDYARARARDVIIQEAGMRDYARQILEAGTQIINDRHWSRTHKELEPHYWNLANYLFNPKFVPAQDLKTFAFTHDYPQRFYNPTDNLNPPQQINLIDIKDLADFGIAENRTLQTGMEDVFFDFARRLPFKLSDEAIREHKDKMKQDPNRKNNPTLYHYSVYSPDTHLRLMFSGNTYISNPFANPRRGTYSIDFIYCIFPDILYYRPSVFHLGNP